jgi:retinol dehydrogenase 12
MHNNAELHGKTCLVTGATNGHGEAVAKALARMGGDIILLGRNSEKCGRVKSEIEAETGKAPKVLLCDLSSLSDIRRAAAEYRSWNRPLHLLVTMRAWLTGSIRNPPTGSRRPSR